VTLLVSALNCERTKAHADLVQSEQRFRNLTRLSSDWFWEQDTNFQLVRIEGSGADRANSVFGEIIGSKC
jgi:PAS domain-containing protein